MTILGMSPLECAVCAVILLGFAVVIWRGGAANPESTGALGRKIAGLSNKVTTLQGKVDRLERDTASVKDIARLEQKIDGHHELAARTEKIVDRILTVMLDGTK